jgi:hypothetical protein
MEELERTRELRERMREEEEEAERERLERIKNNIDAVGDYGSALTTVMGVFADVFDTMAEAADEDSEAQKRAAKIKGGILAAVSFVEAAIEYGRAIASFASQDYASGALHLAAGIKLTAAGVLSLRNLGGKASQGEGAGAATGSFVPEREDTRDRDQQGEGSQIVIYTMGSSSARLGQEMVDLAERVVPASGLEGQMAGSGQFG